MTETENVPAFPRAVSITDTTRTWGGRNPVYPIESAEGMSLRDWFAGQAINGFASQCDSTGTWSWLMEDAAIDAYRVADAMLAARKDSQ